MSIKSFVMHLLLHKCHSKHLHLQDLAVRPIMQPYRHFFFSICSLVSTERPLKSIPLCAVPWLSQDLGINGSTKIQHLLKRNAQKGRLLVACLFKLPTVRMSCREGGEKKILPFTAGNSRIALLELIEQLLKLISLSKWQLKLSDHITQEHLIDLIWTDASELTSFALIQMGNLVLPRRVILWSNESLL